MKFHTLGEAHYNVQLNEESRLPFLDRRHSSCLWAVYKSITLDDLHKTDDNTLISSVLLQ